MLFFLNNDIVQFFFNLYLLNYVFRPGKTNEIQKKRIHIQSVAFVQTINAEEVRVNLRDAKLSYTRWREIFKGALRSLERVFRG